MLLVISPAKKLDFETAPCTQGFTLPQFIEEAKHLVEHARQLSAAELCTLSKISRPLAELNARRFREWRLPFSLDNAKQAVLAFKGDVYKGLSAEDFSERELQFAQKHLRILSGLYGLLRPLDLIQPYRLEMGSRLKTDRGADLYSFWGDGITQALNEALKSERDKTLVNLASSEYFKSVNPLLLQGRLITPQFKQKRDGRYQIIGLLAKKARGWMSRYAIKNRLGRAEELQAFDAEDYRFNEGLSDAQEWVFTRESRAPVMIRGQPRSVPQSSNL
ncbi:MAG: peroxide stress protein YaaA [Gammaproteobacteria bacterium]